MHFHISKEGITIEQFGDLIVYPFFWLKEKRKFSHRLMDFFDSYSEYWKRIGILEHELVTTKKLVGFNWEDILKEWLKTKLSYDPMVIIFELDLSQKPKEFWAKIPPENRLVFRKDVIVMSCRNVAQAIEISESINEGFGKSFVVYKGNIV